VKRAMIALLLTVTSADAHSWYPRECCSDQHCFPVPCNELHNSMSGVEWHHRVFGGRQIKPSQDQACHVCVIVDGLIPDQPICVFIPLQTSQLER
jgi:hypothetical protein